VAATIKIKTRRQYGSLDSVVKNMRSNSSKATYEFARAVAAGARARIQNAYPPASLPGNPPHQRSGELLRSIRREKVGEAEHQVVVGAEHGAYVEYGTRKMAARPFFRPAVEEAKRKFLRDARAIYVGHR
jgi:HK97 gp10 family phage protein